MADFVTSVHRAPGETAPEWLDRLQKIGPIPLALEEQEFLHGYITPGEIRRHPANHGQTDTQAEGGGELMDAAEEARRRLEAMPHVLTPQKMKAIEDQWRKRAVAGDGEALKFLKSLEKDKPPREGAN
jgi:hypothetical protein